MIKPIAIIDCAINGPSYNCMNKLVEHFDRPFTYHWVSKFGLDSLDFIDEASGHIIFGSDSNVSDKLPWQIELAQKMKEKIQSGIPVMGICFGHQLIAQAFGAKVERLTRNPNGYFGLRDHQVLESLHGFNKGESLSTFTTHKHEVKTLPKDFVHLSTSEDCFFEGLAHRDLKYFSFQGHPEASRLFVKNEIRTSLTPKQVTRGIESGLSIIEKFINLTKS